MNFLRTFCVIVLVAALGMAACIYFGAFNVAADVPHGRLVYRLLELARQRSIAARASSIAVPPLNDPGRVAEGAEHYAAMCAGCHLAPGLHESELRDGLYPVPPDFTQRNDIDPAQMSWAIKHGVKLTAMPAWGKSHDDEAIWSLVAFVRTLPEMTPAQYQQATAGAASAHEHHLHDHASGGTHEHGADERGDDHHAESSASTERQVEVRARGPDVMPFSLDATQHIFEKTAEGGIQRVIARTGHADQVAMIRDHLQGIARAFTARDFSGPAHIHGTGMPGLAELKSTPSTELIVSYRDIDSGGEVTYRGTTEKVRNAIHHWFDAQLADHGRDATDHESHSR